MNLTDVKCIEDVVGRVIMLVEEKRKRRSFVTPHAASWNAVAEWHIFCQFSSFRIWAHSPRSDMLCNWSIGAGSAYHFPMSSYSPFLSPMFATGHSDVMRVEELNLTKSSQELDVVELLRSTFRPTARQTDKRGDKHFSPEGLSRGK